MVGLCNGDKPMFAGYYLIPNIILGLGSVFKQEWIWFNI